MEENQNLSFLGVPQRSFGKAILNCKQSALMFFATNPLRISAYLFH